MWVSGVGMVTNIRNRIMYLIVMACIYFSQMAVVHLTNQTCGALYAYCCDITVKPHNLMRDWIV